MAISQKFERLNVASNNIFLYKTQNTFSEPVMLKEASLFFSGHIPPSEFFTPIEISKDNSFGRILIETSVFGILLNAFLYFSEWAQQGKISLKLRRKPYEF